MSISKIKEIKIREEDGSYSDPIPMGADAINIDYKDTNVENELDKLNNENNSKATRINNLEKEDIDLQNQIKSLASGSPKGSYMTVSELINANPNTGVYIIQENGHIYSWTKNQSSDPIDLGIYQSTGIADNSIGYNHLNESAKRIFNNNLYLIKGKKLDAQGQLEDSNAHYTLSDYIYIDNTNNYVGLADESKNHKKLSIGIRFYDENKNFLFTYNAPDKATPQIFSLEKNYITYANSIKYFRLHITDVYDSNYKIRFPTEQDITDFMNGLYIIKRINNKIIYENVFGIINDKNVNKTVTDNSYIISKNYEYNQNGYSIIKPEFHKFTILNDGSWCEVQFQNITNSKFFNKEKIVIKGLNSNFRIKEFYYNDDETFNSVGSWITGNGEDIEFTFNNKGRISICTFINNVSAPNLTNIDEILNTIDIVSYPLIKETKESKFLNNYMHISFDDVTICIQHLIAKQNKYTSLFEEPFFNLLKTLHETYGACFSLYIFNLNILPNLTNKFANDFKNNSDWLKLGFHSLTKDGHLDQYTPEQALQQYNDFISNAYRITGGLNSIDRIPRLNYYQADTDDLIALRDTDCGIIGTLTADDDRIMNYLTEPQRQYLRTHSKLIDINTGLTYLSTTLRLDWFLSNYTNENQYYKPVKTNPYDELVYRYSRSENADYYSTIIVFAHEWQMYNTNYIVDANFINYLKQTCQFAKDYQYDFDFPQNRIQDMTSLALNNLI